MEHEINWKSNLNSLKSSFKMSIHAYALIYDSIYDRSKLPTPFDAINLRGLNETFTALNYELKFSFSSESCPWFPHPLRDKVKRIKFSSVARYFSLCLSFSLYVKTVHYTKMNMFFLPNFFIHFSSSFLPFQFFSFSFSLPVFPFFLSPARNQLFRFLTVNFVQDRKHRQRQHFLSFWEVFQIVTGPRLNLWRCISRTVSMKTFFYHCAQ